MDARASDERAQERMLPSESPPYFVPHVASRQLTGNKRTYHGGIMLRTIERFLSYDIQATDGGIGKVHDIYFDDEHSRKIKCEMVRQRTARNACRDGTKPCSIDQPGSVHGSRASHERGCSRSPGFDPPKLNELAEQCLLAYYMLRRGLDMENTRR